MQTFSTYIIDLNEVGAIIISFHEVNYRITCQVCFLSYKKHNFYFITRKATQCLKITQNVSCATLRAKLGVVSNTEWNIVIWLKTLIAFKVGLFSACIADTPISVYNSYFRNCAQAFNFCKVKNWANIYFLAILKTWNAITLKKMY